MRSVGNQLQALLPLTAMTTAGISDEDSLITFTGG
jgi:hypothetical protein